MKMLVITATAGLLLAGSVFAQENITAPRVRRNALPPPSSSQYEGSLQRGLRLGNPIQMFNPFAPREYGDGRDFVKTRGDDPGLHQDNRSRRFPSGLRLFSFAF